MKTQCNNAKHAVEGIRGGRVTKWRGKIASIAPGVVLMLLGSVASPVLSDTISGVETTTRSVPSDGNLTVTPSGQVTVTGTTGATAIDFGSDYVGSFINQGSVSAEVTASDGSDDALALYFIGDLKGASVLNAGNISATTMGNTTGGNVSVTARGVYIDGDVTDGTVFTGMGNITINATGGNSESSTENVETSVEDTYGIFVNGWVSNASSFSQSGDVSLNAVGGSGQVVGSYSATTRINEVAGIRTGRIQGSAIELSGDVSVKAYAGDSESDGSTDASIDEVSGVWFREGIYSQSSASISGNISVIAEAGNAAGGGSASLYVEQVGALVIRGSVTSADIDNSGNLSVVVKGGTGVGSTGRKNTYVNNVAGILFDSTTMSDGSTLTSSGNISVLAESGVANGDAYVRNVGGIQIFEQSITEGSSLNNSGEISVTARSIEGGASAHTQNVAGISVIQGRLIGRTTGDTVDYSELINSGNITVSAQAGSSSRETNAFRYGAYALDTAGILIDREVRSGNVLNSGDFNISSIAGSDQSAAFADARSSAYGIRVGWDLRSTNPSLQNTGTTVSNSGRFIITAVGGTAIGEDRAESSASAFGVDFRSIFDGSAFNNSGDMTVTATGGVAIATDGDSDASAVSRGLHVRGTRLEDPTTGNPIDPPVSVAAGSTFNNSGNLFVTATAGNAAVANASAYGISLGEENEIFVDYKGGVDGTVINSGNVSAIATATTPNGAASAYAMHMFRVGETGVLTSTGDLTGRASGDSGIGSGLWVDGDMDGRVDLRGWIRGVGVNQIATGVIQAGAGFAPSGADPEVDSYAIYFGGGDGDLNITAPTWFVGALKIEDQSVSLTSGNYHSVHWVFDFGKDADFTLIEGDGVPWFSRNGDTQSGEYATFNTSGFELQDQAIAGVARFGDNRMRRYLSDDTARSRPLVWIEGGMVTEEFEGQTAGSSSDVTNTGGVGGLAWQLGEHFGVGLLAGSVTSDASADNSRVSPQSLGANSMLVGAAVAARLNGLTIDGGIKAGSTDMDSARLVNYNLAVPQDGAEYADGSFNAAWTRVALGATYDYALTDDLTITPEVVLAYTNAEVEGYSEEGATANASVDSRSATLTELEVALNFSHAVGPGVVLGSVGYVSLSTGGDDTIDVSLIGDTQSVGVESSDYAAARVELGYSYNATDNLSFDIEGSVLSGKDWQSQNLSASATLRF